MKNDNVGKCGHAKCAGGNGVLCFKKGTPMSTYQKEGTTCDHCASTDLQTNSSGEYTCNNCGYEETEQDNQ